MGLMSKRKGRRWEQEVARRCSEAFDVDAHRGQQSRSGDDASDVTNVPGLHIECKVGARPPFEAALRQAQRDATSGSVPVAVVKRDRQRPVVVMDFEDWLEMARAAMECEEAHKVLDRLDYDCAQGQRPRRRRCTRTGQRDAGRDTPDPRTDGQANSAGAGNFLSDNKGADDGPEW